MVTGFGTDLIGELKLLCWEVGAGTPWYYAEKYIKSPLVFLFRPVVSMQAYKLGKTQHSLYDLEDELLRSKTLQEVVHYIESGKFPASWEKMKNNPKNSITRIITSVLTVLVLSAGLLFTQTDIIAAQSSNFQGGEPVVGQAPDIKSIRLLFSAGTRTSWHTHSWGDS